MKRSRKSRKEMRQIGNKTINDMKLSKPMDMEVIKRINSNLLALTMNEVTTEPRELKDWQKDLMKK